MLLHKPLLSCSLLPAMETWTEKFTRKFKENPLVPLGAAATVATLIIASKKMRRGESQQMNHWLRARVAAQGFTILAICGGAYWVNKQKREAALAEAISNQGTRVDAETLRLDKERKEFEERLQEAEKAHRIMTESQGSGTGSSKAGESNTSPTSTPTWLGWKRTPSTVSTSASEPKKESVL